MTDEKYDDEPTVVFNTKPEILEGMLNFMQGKKPDFTVTHTQLDSAWDRGGSKGFLISWGTKSAGFGELAIFQTTEGELRIDNESMGPDFCKRVLFHLLSTVWASQYGVNAEGPLLTDDASVLRKSIADRLHGIMGDVRKWESPEVAEAQVTLILQMLYPEKYEAAYREFRLKVTPKDIESPLHQVAADSKDLKILLVQLWGTVDSEVAWKHESTRPGVGP